MPRHRKGHEEEHEEGPSAERWLLTYSDMITLLMVLFIVLFALGQTDIRKFDAFKDSFHQLQSNKATASPHGGPGVLSQPSAIALILSNPFARLDVSAANSESGEKVVGDKASGQQRTGDSQSSEKVKGQVQSSQKVTGQQRSGEASIGQKATEAAINGRRTTGQHLSPSQERKELEHAEQEMEQALRAKGLEGDVTVSLRQKGLVVSILTDKVLFPLDSATLQPEGVAIIDAIAPVLVTLPNDVDVEGDTDNTPIHGGPYSSNWALSAARAVAVVTDLIDNHHVQPDRLQATGYGDTEPVVPNNTAEHRAENRRVEIVIFSTTAVSP